MTDFNAHIKLFDENDKLLAETRMFQLGTLCNCDDDVHQVASEMANRFDGDIGRITIELVDIDSLNTPEESSLTRDAGKVETDYERGHRHGYAEALDQLRGQDMGR